MRRAIAPLMLAAGLLCACGPQVALDALASSGRGRVTQAPSGDSLSLGDGLRVRLAGVEAPRGEEPYAVEARTALAKLAVGRDVELLQGGARQDPFGRTVAHVRDAANRRWLQGELLRQGAARVRTFSDNRALAAPLLLEEARARTARLGLWALSAYRVRLPQEVGAGDRGLMLVEGRVGNVVREAGRLRFGFVEAPGGLVVEVPRASWDDFAVAGVDPSALKGRLVRVRGVVRAARGQPRLWLDHPEQIERLREP